MKVFITMRNILVPILTALADREHEYNVTSDLRRCTEGNASIPKRQEALLLELQYYERHIPELEEEMFRIEAAKTLVRDKKAAEAQAVKQAKIDAKVAKKAAKQARKDGNAESAGYNHTPPMPRPAAPPRPKGVEISDDELAMQLSR